MLTPFPRGPMPQNVRRWDDGPPFGRLHLDTEWTVGTTAVVMDAFTGESFRITPADCGAGCRCAAEAEWLP